MRAREVPRDCAYFYHNPGLYYILFKKHLSTAINVSAFYKNDCATLGSDKYIPLKQRYVLILKIFKIQKENYIVFSNNFI